MANPFVHIELQTQDLDKSKKFYAGMFDWKLEEIPGMDYTMINVGEGTGGCRSVTMDGKNPFSKMEEGFRFL